MTMLKFLEWTLSSISMGRKNMIEGKKVIIRPIEAGDEKYLYKWWNDGKMMAHSTNCFGTLQSMESVRASIEKDIYNTDMFPDTKRFIICRKNDMEPIGEMNYCGLDRRNQKCEFGIKICEVSQQEKGYGSDALIHFIDFIFRFLNLNKIELTTMQDNKRAQHVYEKLGFKRIGIIRQGCFDSRTGKFSDDIYMDMLKDEWMVKRGELL